MAGVTLPAAAMAVLAPAWLALPAMADETEPPAPALSIAIDADVDELEPGDTVSYEVTVINPDTESDAELTVGLTAPDQAKALLANEGGEVDGPTVTWPLTVEAGSDVRLRTALATGQLRDGLRGYPVRACVEADDEAETDDEADAADVPLTCATEITQVAGQPDVRTGEMNEDGGPNWLVVVVGGALGGLVAYLVRSRRRNTEAQPS
jgi:hypothetical protein